MIKRQLEQEIIDRLQPNKVMLLMGARRVGKTVLIREICKKIDGDYLFLNGEDHDTHLLLEQKTIANFRHVIGNNNLLVIDEAQNIPDIGAKLKLMVDDIPGIRIIASGSSSFDLLNKSGEPLVGRSTTFYLYPFSQQELIVEENSLQTRQNLEKRVIYGAYPEVVTMSSDKKVQEYLIDMVNAYLMKDILMIDGLRSTGKIGNLLKLIAFQVGSEVSYDELGRQLGMSKNTVEKYLDLLSKVFVIFRLGGFSRNLRKEVTKTGKWYFWDLGVRNAIIGNFSPLAVRSDIGQLWENYLISERLKRNNNQMGFSHYYFWRTYDGQEIDLIEEDNQSLAAFEFKWREKSVRPPVAFANAYPNSIFSTFHQSNYLDFVM